MRFLPFNIQHAAPTSDNMKLTDVKYHNYTKTNLGSTILSCAVPYFLTWFNLYMHIPEELHTWVKWI